VASLSTATTGRPPTEFGGFTSNGCVGMLNADAAWFWDFLGEGSMINIHF
jgi:lipoprotein-anchoring transpeptidase ErfK/SrfK